MMVSLRRKTGWAIIFLVLGIAAAGARASDIEKSKRDYARMIPVLEKAKRHMAAGELAKAEKELNRCLGLAPDAPEVCFHLAQIHYLKGKYEESLTMVEKAIKNFPDFKNLIVTGKEERFDSLERQKEAFYEKIAEMERTAEEAACQRVTLNREIDILKKEIESLSDEQKRIGLEEPQIPAGYIFLCGNCLFKLHRYGEAESRYIECINADSLHAEAYNNLINLYYFQKNYQKANELITRAEGAGVPINPKLKEAVRMLTRAGG